MRTPEQSLSAPIRFGANGLKFDNVEELVQAATALVRRTGKKVVLDIGPLGKLLQPMGELAFDDAYDLFARTIRAGAPVRTWCLLRP